jgi:hypothetical protein
MELTCRCCRSRWCRVRFAIAPCLQLFCGLRFARKLALDVSEDRAPSHVIHAVLTTLLTRKQLKVVGDIVGASGVWHYDLAARKAQVSSIRCFVTT